MSEKATIHYDGKSIDVGILEGTEGERAPDLQALRKHTGLVGYDPAYGNTGSCSSASTFIDGE